MTGEKGPREKEDREAGKMQRGERLDSSCDLRTIVIPALEKRSWSRQ
jgi:hypothetical protein